MKHLGLPKPLWSTIVVCSSVCINLKETKKKEKCKITLKVLFFNSVNVIW